VKVTSTVRTTDLTPDHYMWRQPLNRNRATWTDPGLVRLIGRARVGLNGVFDTALDLESLSAKQHPRSRGIFGFFSLARASRTVSATHG
jgi:hypothetical protein